jgi:hypothetical protein
MDIAQMSKQSLTLPCPTGMESARSKLDGATENISTSSIPPIGTVMVKARPFSRASKVSP